MGRRDPNDYTDNGDGTVTIHVRGLKHNGDSLINKSDHERLLALSNPRCHLRDGYLYNTEAGYIHAFVIGKARKGYEIDHINRDKLNNTRENLRFATLNENRSNLGQKKGRKLPRNIGHDKRCPNNPFYWQFQWKGETYKKRGFDSLEKAVKDLREEYLKITNNHWTGDQ